jgi:hypothetical protein
MTACRTTTAARTGAMREEVAAPTYNGFADVASKFRSQFGE